MKNMKKPSVIVRVADPYYMCDRKRKYNTNMEAVIAAIKATTSESQANAYHCPFCKKYHWGHTRSKPGEIKYVMPREG